MKFKQPATMFVREIKGRLPDGTPQRVECDAHSRRCRAKTVDGTPVDYREAEFKPLRAERRFRIIVTPLSPPFSLGAAWMPHKKENRAAAARYQKRLAAMRLPTSFVAMSQFRRFFCGIESTEVDTGHMTRNEAFAMAAERNRRVAHQLGEKIKGPETEWAMVVELGTALTPTVMPSLDAGDIGTFFTSMSYPMRVVAPTEKELRRYPIDWDAVRLSEQGLCP